MTKAGTFRRKDRLRKTGQFRRVYDAGGFCRKEFLILRSAYQHAESTPRLATRARLGARSGCRPQGFAMAPRPWSEGSTRIGISISSRDVPLASMRNRFKRIIREAYRRNKARLLTGYDLVLIVKGRPTGVISLARIEDLFLTLCAKAKIIR